ncbi:MAG: hypothetical protein ABUS57_06800 [Pseudomonadota bacterium]
MQAIGRLLLALGMGGLGVLSLMHHDFSLEWTPVPSALANHDLLAYAHGGFLVLGALGLLVPMTRQAAAFALAALWAFYSALHVPLAIADWKAGVGGLAECVGLTAGCLLASGSTLAQPIARYSFGLAMPVFGLVHFLYPDAVATWIPGYIPGPGVYWAYATGAAHVAAGLAMLTGVMAPIASLLNALMYTSWLLILHLPRTYAAPHDRHEWTTTCVAFAINGAAWMLATYLAHRKR